MLIDTHAHINYFKDPKKVIEESLAAGVKKIVVPGVTPEEFGQVAELSEKYDCIYGALGVHPCDCETFNNDAANKMTELLKHPKMVAVGEIGLDYHWNKENAKEQKRVFEMQLEIAKALDLPVLIHDRDAHLDCFEILKASGHKKIIMHCFSGSLEFAQQCVKEGWYIAIGGVVTFKNAKKLKDVAHEIPLENIMLETDCPYLAPHPFRGEENSPKYLPFIAKEIANIKDIMYDEVVETTGLNALKFFGIKEE
jgi:TatD DNase family protein